MAVFRVEHKRNFTVVDNEYSFDVTISLKAKGLLTQMLTLSKEWDYTLMGLTTLNKEGIDSIREGIKELEAAGYVQRMRIRNSKGQLVGTEYVIYERPQNSKPDSAPSSEKAITHAKTKTIKKRKHRLATIEPQYDEPLSSVSSLNEVAPSLPNPTLVAETETPSPITFSPTLEKPIQEQPAQENPTLLNTKLTLTNTYPNQKRNTHDESHPSIMVSKPTERRSKGRMDEMDLDSLHRFYQCEIRSNLDYFELPLDYPYAKLDEIIAIMADALCTRHNAISIGGTYVPISLVRERFLSLRSEHIEYVMDCMQKTKTMIRNIKQYMLTALYNAPTTIKSYYDALFAHERYEQQQAYVC